MTLCRALVTKNHQDPGLSYFNLYTIFKGGLLAFFFFFVESQLKALASKVYRPHILKVKIIAF